MDVSDFPSFNPSNRVLTLQIVVAAPWYVGGSAGMAADSVRTVDTSALLLFLLAILYKTSFITPLAETSPDNKGEGKVQHFSKYDVWAASAF